MKRGKFFFIAIIFIAIILIQPGNREGLKSLLTQNDIATQFGWGQLAEEKKSELDDEHDVQNAQLKNKVYDGQQVITVNDKAQFSESDLSLNKGSWEHYSDLDFLNRVGQADALLGKDLLPQKSRGDISSVKPTGWKNKKIDFNGQSDYLYNRSHLIGFQLTGQDANIKNLFTGTRALNANFENEKNSMVYYENKVATYIKSTGHHVRYRVTPIFKNVELVCRGIRIEAQSVEDDSLSFDVYLFNVQPGYSINYLTGTSSKE